MNKILEKLQKPISIISILVFILAFYIPNTNAAAITSVSDTMTRLKAATASSHDISFTLAGANTFAAGETITVDFDEDGGKFTIDGAGSTTADFDFNDGTERVIYNVGAATDCTGSVGVNDVSVGVNDTTGVVTMLACPSYTASGAAATVNIEYGTAAGGTNRVTNSAAGTKLISIGGTFGDSGQLGVVIVSDDQVVVNATVDPTITFTITTNSVTLLTAAAGNPDSSNTAYNGSNTLAAATNADNGYVITYLGSTLTSGGNTITAMAAQAASSTGSEQFGINLMNNATPNVGADPSGGSGTAGADYGTADQYKFVAGTTTNLASAAGPSQTTTYTVSYIANVADITEAGAYSTTLTYICTGTF